MDIIETLGDIPLVQPIAPSTRLGRRAVLFHLVIHCHPKPSENVETLRQLLKGRKVSPKRLREAGELAPQWREMINGVLGSGVPRAEGL